MYSVCIVIYESICLPIYTGHIWTSGRGCMWAIRGAPDVHGQVKSETHSETMIEVVSRYTGRPSSRDFGDALGCRNWASVEMHLVATIERTQRCTWIAMIIWTRWYTPGTWSSQTGDKLGGVRSEVRRLLRLYLSVSWHANMGMWRNDFTIQLSLETGWWWSMLLGGMPEADATFRGQLVIVRMKGRQTILGECCTQCMLYSVLTQNNGMERYRGMTELSVLWWW